MTDRYRQDFQSQRAYPVSSYTSGTVIQPGGQPPPPPIHSSLPSRHSVPMVSGADPNVYPKQVLYQKGQFAQEEKDRTELNPFPEAIGQIPMTIYNPTYEQFIVKPPKQNVTHGQIPVQLFISSTDRNFTLYPSPSDYVVELTDEFKNVTSVSLFNACIPNTPYLVGNNNNVLYFQINPSPDCPLEAIIPVGDYNPQASSSTDTTGLDLAMQTAMRTASGDNTIQVQRNPLTNKYEFFRTLTETDYIFKISFYGGSEKNNGRTRAVYPPRAIAPIIGFNRRDSLYVTGKVNVTNGSPFVTGIGTLFLQELVSTVFPYKVTNPAPPPAYLYPITISIPDSTGTKVYHVQSVDSDNQITLTSNYTGPTLSNVCMCSGLIKAPNKFNLASDCMVILQIPELASNSSQGSNLAGNEASVGGAFAVVPMVYPHNTKNFITSQIPGASPYKRYYNPPIPKIKRLTIRMLNLQGVPVDFQGIDNFLEFQIVTLNQPGRYDPEVF